MERVTDPQVRTQTLASVREFFNIAPSGNHTSPELVREVLVTDFGVRVGDSESDEGDEKEIISRFVKALENPTSLDEMFESIERALVDTHPQLIDFFYHALRSGASLGEASGKCVERVKNYMYILETLVKEMAVDLTFNDVVRRHFMNVRARHHMPHLRALECFFVTRKVGTFEAG